MDRKNPAYHRNIQKAITLAHSTINKITHQDLPKDIRKNLMFILLTGIRKPERLTAASYMSSTWQQKN